MTTKKKKSAKQRRVLIVALIVAVAIVAASTFAWFSSKDEVTNRLTASANYNVSIVEDFQPPADWLPGQTINKDVAAVNTGNVDAFVRMWLDGKLRLLNENAVANEPSANGAYASIFGGKTIVKVDDANKTKLGLNYSYTDNNGEITYYKTLSTNKIDNPNDVNNTSTVNENTNIPAMFSEVQSMQAAGVLVYAPTGAKYTWTLEQAEDLYVYDGTKTKLQTVNAGTKVGTKDSTAGTIVVPTGTSTEGNYYGAIDASTFLPETTGLYLFRRNVEPTDDGTVNKYEYSGYYFVKASSSTSGINTDTYFALHTEDSNNNHSDYVVPENAVTENDTAIPTLDQVLPVTPTANLKLFTASETVVTDALTWEYDNTANAQKFTVTYNGGTKPIVIVIDLATIDESPEGWTAILDNDSAPGKGTTFYYNNDLEAGDTTRKLVDSVKLADTTELGAYLAFDFDLDVFLDSIQITLDEERGESAVTVKDGWAAADIDANDTNAFDHAGIMPAAGNATITDGEITSISWS